MSRERGRLRTHLGEAMAGVSARPGRLALTMLGEALGLAALVATVGLATTASGQVADHFDRAAADRVTVQVEPSRAERGARLPEDAADQVRRLDGVEAAGTLTRLPVTDPVRTVAVVDPQAPPDPLLPVLAASPGLLDAVDAHVTGRPYDDGHVARADAVALLGAGAARRLGLGDLAHGPAVFVGDRALTVIGIIDDVSGRGELLDSVVVPETTAARLFGWTGALSLQVQVAPNAAETIARQAPLAVAPQDPGIVVAAAPPTDAALRDRVEGDVSSLLVLLGLVALVAGGVGIANIMLLSVMERIGEIGLRRALGATRGDLMTQFLAESAVVGLLGGIVGTSLGFVTSMLVALSRDWTPVLDVRLLAAPLAGLVVGVLAGAFPAWRAGSLEPAQALRTL
ncbi:ABC transporter permease [Pimelobacter simplex]|uniref:ABC transporter permease n=1 Tax=Nocardioides simplex TaxID=2045 RepID=UPI00214FCBFB|nr:ABC transporter permease [Pimelobacter simplex]UUW90286.1 ABC transporter permease [Pimelobacter simplex]UUW94116.1 ABC transporter permease [Pimelobacter simplex]